jgi:hypothetical protein
MIAQEDTLSAVLDHIVRSRLVSVRWKNGAKWLGLGVVLFAILFPPLYVAVSPEPKRPEVAMGMPVEPQYTVYVADWGHHTSIIIPQAPNWHLGPPGAVDAPWLEYAWGDRRFYQDSNYWPHSIFATLFLPTSSVIYLAGRSRPPSVQDGARLVVRQTVDGIRLLALAGELEREIRRDVDGDRLPASPPVAGYDGRFYAAYGSYLWARDCNRWTVERLKAVGLAGTSWGVITTAQATARLRRAGWTVETR